MDQTILHNSSNAPQIIPPHVAICVAVIDKPHLMFSQDLAVMMYQLGRKGTPCALIHESGSLLPKARNNLISHVEKLEQSGTPFEWIFFMDSDIRFPQYTLLRLMQHNKDIVGCTYVRRSFPHDILGKTLDGVPKDISESDLLEVAALPTGCLLIRRSVFKSLKRPYFRLMYKEETETSKAWEFGEDYVFCSMAHAAGFKIFVDAELSKSIGHISEKVLYPEADGWGGANEKLKEAVKQIGEYSIG